MKAAIRKIADFIKGAGVGIGQLVGVFIMGGLMLIILHLVFGSLVNIIDLFGAALLLGFPGHFNSLENRLILGTALFVLFILVGCILWFKLKGKGDPLAAASKVWYGFGGLLLCLGWLTVIFENLLGVAGIIIGLIFIAISLATKKDESGRFGMFWINLTINLWRHKIEISFVCGMLISFGLGLYFLHYVFQHYFGLSSIWSFILAIFVGPLIGAAIIFIWEKLEHICRRK